MLAAMLDQHLLFLNVKESHVIARLFTGVSYTTKLP